MGAMSNLVIAVLLGVITIVAALWYYWRCIYLPARSKAKVLAPALANVSKPIELTLQAAVHAERERIYADLHDDVGAKLLELVYRAESPENAALARAALKDLRDVVSRTRGEPASLLESLGEMEVEARTRLQSAGIELQWRQDQDIAERRLNSAQHLHLFRIVREAISNVIRHAQADSLDVRLMVAAETLRIEIKDNGIGQEGASDGRGKDNMRKRADQLAGHITWRAATQGGTRVLLSLPLNSDVTLHFQGQNR
jgi:signal transduction histidine kinase